jgi:hypothetical protein
MTGTNGVCEEPPEVFHGRRHGEVAAQLETAKGRLLILEERERQFIAECARLNREISDQRAVSDSLKGLVGEFRSRWIEAGIALAAVAEERDELRDELIDIRQAEWAGVLQDTGGES